MVSFRDERENNPCLTESFKHFCHQQQPQPPCCLYKSHVPIALGLLLQVLEPPRQVVKVDVVRRGGSSADGVCGECVGNGGEFRESVAVEHLGRLARACGAERSLSRGRRRSLSAGLQDGSRTTEMSY